MPAAGDLVGQSGKPIGAARHQHHLMPIRRVDTRASALPMPAEAPVISVTGRRSGVTAVRFRARRRLAGASSIRSCAEIPEKVGGPPEQIVLEFADPAVREGDLPHHLDHAPPPVLVERTVDQAGEVIEVDRLVLGFGRLGDQNIGGGVVEVETPLDDGMKLVPLGLREVAVDRRGMNEQRGGREPVVVLREVRWGACRRP